MSSLITGYNPDVLSCLANLSNDEVFTPPEVANAMLDMLPQELFSDPKTRFLDPACKSGVFLREIAKRLIDGLADQIPDLQERIDHIFLTKDFHVYKYGVLTDVYYSESTDADGNKIGVARTPSDHFPVKVEIGVE